MHERKMYPPRVRLTIRMRDPNLITTIPVRFIGCAVEGKLDIELSLPLGNTIMLTIQQQVKMSMLIFRFISSDKP